jgi:hypothetical protein
VKQTTIRFSHGLWNLLEREADKAGVSIAEFIREAALARAAHAAGQRGESVLGPLSIGEGGPAPAQDQDQDQDRPNGRRNRATEKKT